MILGTNDFMKDQDESRAQWPNMTVLPPPGESPALIASCFVTSGGKKQKYSAGVKHSGSRQPSSAWQNMAVTHMYIYTPTISMWLFKELSAASLAFFPVPSLTGDKTSIRNLQSIHFPTRGRKNGRTNVIKSFPFFRKLALKKGGRRRGALN